MSTDRRPLLDHWLWEPPVFWLYLLASAAVPVVLACLFMPMIGLKALWALAFILMPLIFGVVYRTVGQRVNRVHASAKPAGGARLPALIVYGMTQSPGVVTLGTDALALCPIVGARHTIRFADVSSVREVRWFNGTLLVGKTGFWLTTNRQDRVGFAVPNSAAPAVRAALGHPPHPATVDW